MAARDIGRLLRLSLAASAPADAVAGIVLGSGGWPGGSSPWWLLLASSCVFHGGMALNDWADREHDGRTRPERPIPSGAVSARSALALAGVLLVLGVSLGMLAGPRAGRLVAVVALLAVTYDLVGRGPWVGPLLLGLCRAGNLGAGVLLGLSLAPDAPSGDALAQGAPWILLALPIAYGLYVFLVSRLGRLEDGEDELGGRFLSPRNLLLAMAVALLAPGLIPMPPSPAPLFEQPGIARAAALALGALGAFGLLKRLAAGPLDSATKIPAVMGMALRRLLIFSAAVALSRGAPEAWIAAAVILMGYPLSHALRSAFPPS